MLHLFKFLRPATLAELESELEKIDKLLESEKMFRAEMSSLPQLRAQEVVYIEASRQHTERLYAERRFVVARIERAKRKSEERPLKKAA